MSTGEIRFAQLRPLQTGALEIGFGEVGLEQIRVLQFGALQDGLADNLHLEDRRPADRHRSARRDRTRLVPLPCPSIQPALDAGGDTPPPPLSER